MCRVLNIESPESHSINRLASSLSLDKLFNFLGLTASCKCCLSSAWHTRNFGCEYIRIRHLGCSEGDGQAATEPENRAVLASTLCPRDTWEGFSTGARPA